MPCRRCRSPCPRIASRSTPTTDIVGVVQKTIATKEDTLTDIARRFNVGYEEIVRANPGVDPWLPGENREIVIPSQFILPNAPREGIVINAAAMRLFYYPKVKKGEKQVVHTYPIGIGKVGWKTPEGATKIVRRTKDPVWRPTASIIDEHQEERRSARPAVVPAGPDNPLGRYAFYLGWPTYMIHGTNKPAGVGLRSSHGCIRLYPEDIAQLFELAPIGTQRARREPAVRVRLARRRVAHPGLRRARRRSARLEEGAGEAAQQGDGRAHPEGARGAQGKDRLGSGLEARRTSRAAFRCRCPAVPISSITSSPPRRSCRTRSRRARPGTASPTCRWTKKPSRSSSPIASRRWNPRPPPPRRRTKPVAN